MTECINPPPGEVCRYGGAWLFQVAPKTAAAICCLRNEGYPAGDFENGSDVFLFDDLDRIDPAQAIPIVRNDKYVDTKGQRRIVIHYNVVGGFVPLGALRDDGTPHPHAGTGFGVSTSLDFPLLGSGHYSKSHKRTKVIWRTHVYQFSYDTHFFLIDDFEVYGPDEPLRPSESGTEWPLLDSPLKYGVPDGDDFLVPIGASYGDLPQHKKMGSGGVSRWRRGPNGWAPVSYVPVVFNADDSLWMEPSLVRDVDGSLLFTARGAFEDDNFLVPIFRSTDGGATWTRIISKENGRAEAPITINQAVDGTPYIVCNKHGHQRDWLVIQPLNDDRTDLLDEIHVRNALEEFGPPPSNPGRLGYKERWMVDHASGETLRLGDGEWHHVLSYRNMDRGEHFGAAPTECTGHYLEEVFSDGPPKPVWKFE
ncbi:MAG: hypothetical protein CMJ18_21810 [Phycisphaeraceae bacterium]|nr:hypothetical protein [Phycisphaeraceae bacterium]